MSISGLTLGFTKGWSLALAMLGIGPIFIMGMCFFGNALKQKVSVVMRAYS